LGKNNQQMVKSPQILVELQDWMGDDRKIAEAAWVSSFNKESRERKTDEQVADLVKRLAKDGHSTPFESVVFRFWMRIPIFTDRQIVTHRIASHSGLSGRYRTMPTDYYEIPDDIDEIIHKIDNLPNIFPTPTEPSTKWTIFQAYYESCETATNNYKLGIDKLRHYEKQGEITNKEYKRCREILRGQLPTAGMTERTSIFNLRSFANFQRLRNSEHAQPEIQQVAQLMLEEVEKANICLIAISALKNQNWIL
jgi:thymidylate synthase (FAD)